MLRIAAKRCNQYHNYFPSSGFKRHFHPSLCQLLPSLNNDESITIGNVTVPNSPRGSNRPDLIPTLVHTFTNPSYYSNLQHHLPPCHTSHLRWMLQKDLILHQDFLLIGTPNLAKERRELLLLYASLLNREVEYISLSKDTSEADLKQRKEVLHHGTVYVNQAPVRAAMHGRLLILDGLEKAERNVLPTLNNLLENRELPLEDGSILVPSDRGGGGGGGDSSSSGSSIPVHPDFRVAAMASIPSGEGSTLDPPLRSRFQARLVNPVEIGNVLESVAASGYDMDEKTFKHLIQSAGEVVEGVPLQSVRSAARYLSRYNQSGVGVVSALKAYGISSSGGMIGADDVLSPLKETGDSSFSSKAGGKEDFIMTETIRKIKTLIHAALENERAVVLVGPKGCYKSSIARDASQLHGNPELFSLHADLGARDLIMFRTTDNDKGGTIWVDTPLTKAARKGGCVILDGIDKLRHDTLSSLALLMEQGWISLPDGTRLVADDAFRCIAIAHFPSEEKSWITPEVQGMFHWIEVSSLPVDELRDVLRKLHPALDEEVLEKILQLQNELNNVVVDSVAEQESLQLSLRKLKHICRRVERDPKKLGQIISNTLLMDFLPEWEFGIVKKCMKNAGISLESHEYQTCDYNLDMELLEACKRVSSNPLLVPSVRFQENAGQSKVMGDILEAHSVGEKALLVLGNQGNGKNKVVDKLLSLLNCEREYIQLHRDTTVQSLLLAPSIENGRIVYHDSPLVRAAKYGRILVLDEADKAPVEVVAVLKGLIEDGHLSLPDGRVLSNLGESSSTDDAIQIHPDFSIWTLANPAGWPFHGNDLAREMSDVFSCHNVPAMDMESHKEILSSYGNNVSPQLINKIVGVWEDLRVAHQRGTMSYPFSIRESIAVVKHLNAFPGDGVEEAVSNVIAFDRLDSSLTKHIGEMFHGHGITLEERGQVAHMKEGISTPKTRSSLPKVGKFDPENKPHVGGNTWAGGTGGSDTAGLGGRGGPYRLDSGHPIHQVSDEMKAEVSEESKRRAREMSKEAFEKKLKDLDMGKLDWKRYQSIRNAVDEQITQLKSLLKDLKRRSEERIWLKHQSSGEIDENRIVDALSGERDVFKRRGNPDANHDVLPTKPITIKLVVDISASMYRFNSYDGRLQRLLESTTMLMETFRDDKRFKLHIIGHSGSSSKIPLANPETSLDEATQLKLLECMVANTQYTYAGDNTVEAISDVISQSKKGDLVIIISDANLQRYHIGVDDLSPLHSKDVHSHLVFIGSLGNEASELARQIPNERAAVCFESSDLPLILKKIVSNSLKH